MDNSRTISVVSGVYIYPGDLQQIICRANRLDERKGVWQINTKQVDSTDIKVAKCVECHYFFNIHKENYYV
jgi:hypothetical protein